MMKDKHFTSRMLTCAGGLLPGDMQSPDYECGIWVAMSKLWHTDFLEFYDGDTLCGFVYLAHSRKLVFIM